MAVTVLPDAVELGLDLYANTSARTLEWNGRKVTTVHAEVLDPVKNRPTGVKVRVHPKLMVVSGGAINSPGLLMRSGLDAEGRVGQRTWLHPVMIMMGLFDREVKPFAGAPQSVYSHHFIERGPGKVGFFLEVAPIHPMIASTVGTGGGPALQELVSQLPHVNATISLHVDGLLPEEEGATVRLKDGAYSRYSIDYGFQDAHWESFRAGCKEIARIQFAAGARKVMSLHLKPVVLESVKDLGLLDQAPFERLQVRVATAHQMGGCAMGKDPARSVVDTNLRYHTMDNLYVVDGSVLPTSLGVNPQETIFGIARWAAGHLAQAV
jgi:choline dehydrogenase-like flavoprotein